MAYATGSLTDANSSQALYNVLAGLLTTANYTLVDTVVISTRTHKVWKSAAANNSMNLDWYLDVAYTTTGVGPVHLTPFEYFDPATDLGYRGSYAINDPTIEATYGSRYGGTGYELETYWFGAQNGGGILTSASALGYWLSVTGDRVIALSSLAPTLLRYAGFYVPKNEYASLAGGRLFPLIKAEFSTAVGAEVPGAVGLTRTPPATSLPFGWSRILTVRPEITYSEIKAVSPTIGQTNIVGDVASTTRLMIGGVSSYYSGMLWGWLKDVVVVPVSPSVVRGDTMTIGSDSYVLGGYDGAFGAVTAFKAV